LLVITKILFWKLIVFRTEHMETPSTVEYQVFPRLIGMSEALWSPKGNKSYIEFLSRYSKHKPLLKKLGLNYGPESVGIEITTKISEDRKLLLQLNSVDDIPLDMHYTLDGTTPDKNSPKFGNIPIYLPTSCKVHAIGFYQGQTYGMVRDQDIVVNKATCQHVQYIQKYANQYPGRGEMTLVDGIRGNEIYRSSAWQGWLGIDFDVIVHFQRPVSIRKVQTGFMQNINSYIWLPEWVEVSISQDGKNFILIGKTVNTIPKDQQGTILKDIIVEFDKREVLKVRIKAKSIGICPPWHPGKGSRAWTFVDQILMF
jgi:hexosaminidase